MRAIFWPLFGIPAVCGADVAVTELRCEYQKNPVGSGKYVFTGLK